MAQASPSDKKTVALSVVCPVFNEVEGLRAFHDRLIPALETFATPFEVIYVDDGSKDGSAELIDGLHDADPRIKALHFSRNFGHQMAITAGMDCASGDACVVMDTDGQDPPEVIGEMLARWRQGFEVVYAVRAKREHDTVFKRATAALFYRLMGKLARIDIPVDAGDFRLMDRRVVEVMRRLREGNRFVRGLIAWAGFRYTSVEYVRKGRLAGETHYPLLKMVRFAADGITSFSHEPLRWVTFCGVGCSAVSVALAGWALYVKLFTESAVQGWTSMMAVILFMGGIQMLSLGIVGEYLGRVFDEVKNRPLYVVRDARGLEAPRA